MTYSFVFNELAIVWQSAGVMFQPLPCTARNIGAEPFQLAAAFVMPAINWAAVEE